MTRTRLEKIRDILEKYGAHEMAKAKGYAHQSIGLSQTAALTAIGLIMNRSPAAQLQAEPMGTLGRDEPTVRFDLSGGGEGFADRTIAPLCMALNQAGMRTIASCSGHGQRPGNVMLEDGRELIVTRSWDESRLLEGFFPGINGEPPRNGGLLDEVDKLVDRPRLEEDQG